MNGTAVCVVCGASIKTYPSWAVRRKFCSQACRQATRSPKISRDPATLFWSRVDRSGDCWPWQAGRSKGGYGRVRWDGRASYAHRVAYELTKGPIPDGMCICHACDNPICCNPSHLWLGTKSDNNADRDKKGRLKAALEREDVKVRLREGYALRSERAKAQWADPEKRAAILAGRGGRCGRYWSDEARANLKAAMNRPDVRARISATLKKTLKERKNNHV